MQFLPFVDTCQYLSHLNATYNATRDEDGRYSRYTVANFTCPPGKVPDQITLHCLKYGRWSDDRCHLGDLGDHVLLFKYT